MRVRKDLKDHVRFSDDVTRRNMKQITKLRDMECFESVWYHNCGRKAGDDGDKENSRQNKSAKTDSCIEIVEIEKQVSKQRKRHVSDREDEQIFEDAKDKNWRAAEAKHGENYPKKQKRTNLTGDTGPSNSNKLDLDMGDTDILNNSNSNNMGYADLHSNINCSNPNDIGDTDLHPNANNSNKYNAQRAHIHFQTNLLKNQTEQSHINYAKKHSRTNIQTNLLQSQNEQTKNNPEQAVSKDFISLNAKFLKFETFDQYDLNFLDISRDSQYEILHVCISSKDTVVVLNKQIKKYFVDQEVREKERQKELISKRNSRQEEEFKKRELIAKRETRKNEDFKKRERIAKRETRKNEDFKKENLLLKEMLERMKITKNLRQNSRSLKEIILISGRKRDNKSLLLKERLEK
ncbi:unnamed protein product [Mytilus coruscus]|uniref:Uncharacterized protein n=1 Tax=Mytilus coruscus TaxID=42192 RepID=A0A6J7ZRL7_MYTCO|nr:unnamed protein product [Mytilus coruscus]